MIRVLGLAYVRDVRIDLFSVKTVPGTTVKVRCIGKGCPRRKASSTRARTKLVRVRWLERQTAYGHSHRGRDHAARPHRPAHHDHAAQEEEAGAARFCLYPDQATPTRCPKK